MAYVKKRSKIQMIVIGVVLLAALAALKFLFFTAPPGPQYITTKARIERIQDTVLASGTFEAIEQVSVGAQVSGRVEKLHVKLGQRVQMGDRIADIDSMTQQNNLKRAQAALTVAQANLAAQQASLVQVRMEYERQQKLRKTDASSKADFEMAQANYKVSLANIKSLQAQIDQAKIDVDIAQVDLGYTQITSPIDGTVVAIVTKEGQTVNANQTAPTIVKVANLDQMTVKAEISEADVTRTNPGQDVFFTILGEPDMKYTAKLRQIEPAPESISSESSSLSSSSSSSSSTAIYYNGLFDVENLDHKFRIDMTAEVNIVRNQVDEAVVIPASALQRDMKSRGYYVRVLGTDGKAEKRLVKVGINNKVSAQITEGLTAGEDIIVGDSGLNRISAGSGRPRGPLGM